MQQFSPRNYRNKITGQMVKAVTLNRWNVKKVADWFSWFGQQVITDSGMFPHGFTVAGSSFRGDNFTVHANVGETVMVDLNGMVSLIDDGVGFKQQHERVPFFPVGIS